MHATEHVECVPSELLQQCNTPATESFKLHGTPESLRDIDAVQNGQRDLVQNVSRRRTTRRRRTEMTRCTQADDPMT